jgi:hypothetical protein
MQQPWKGLAFLLLAGGLLTLASCTPASTTEAPGTGALPTGASAPTASGGDDSAISDDRKITEVANGYYSFYRSCMMDPPPQASGQVSQYCQDNSGLTTASFAANLERGGTAKAGADPVTCSQDPPQSVAVDANVELADGAATAHVTESFGGTQVTVNVQLVMDGGSWRIDNIVCPAP